MGPRGSDSQCLHRPEWLGRDLVAGSLPWSEAVPASLSALLQHYTLRDAHWIGLYAEPGPGATLLLCWSTVHGVEDPEWSILAARFDALERCEIRLRAQELATVLSGPTSRAAASHRTHLVDLSGGDATLVHSPGVRLLCLSPTRDVLPLLVRAETV